MKRSRRGRPSLSRQAQRQRLIAAAREALRVNDFGHIRVADVVKVAGMSSRSFYELFDSKEDLFFELIHEAGRDLVNEMRRILQDAKDPQERLDRGLSAYLRAFAGTPLSLERMGEGATLGVQRVLLRYVREVGALVAGEIDAAHARGEVPRPADPVSIEVLLLGLVGVATRHVAEGRSEDLVALHPAMRALLARAWFTN